MSFISNDSSLWALIRSNRVGNYCVVASSIAVVYDWVITFGQEVDLIWRKHWSFMTVIYLVVRYLGLIYCGVQILLMPVNSIDLSCTQVMLFLAPWQSYISFIVVTILNVVIIIRLYAMYQQSRKMLIILVLIFSAVTIACGGIIIIKSSIIPASVEEPVIFDNYQCVFARNWLLLGALVWVVSIIWEVIALCLAAWIAVKHIRTLPTRWTFGDCMTALIKSHVLYFVFYTAVACSALWEIVSLPSTISERAEFYNGVSQISLVMQMFVFGPRLILSIRQYNAKAVANSEDATAMALMAFRVQTQMSTDHHNV